MPGKDGFPHGDAERAPAFVRLPHLLSIEDLTRFDAEALLARAETFLPMVEIGRAHV